MKENQYNDGFEPVAEYHNQSIKGSACFILGIASALVGDTALYFRWYPVCLLAFVIVAICVVWLIRERQRQDRQYYENYKKLRKNINRLKAETESLRTELELKADKPAKSNIRTGSHPSNEYYKKLIEEEGYHADNRTENPKTEKE